MLQKGYLVVANFAGYEALLVQTELEHAQSIVNDLLTSLLDNIKPPLVFFKLEGDAIFIYIPEESLIQGKTLLDMIENLYCVFARTLETMYRNTVCTCQACQHITSLDLKFVIHYGAYKFTEIDNKQDLMGPDVIILRELFMSPVADQVGTTGYLLLTESCVEAMQLNTQTEDMKAYSSNFENIGEIKGFAKDLHLVWESERKQQQLTVSPDHAWFEVEIDLPVCAALAWEYVTEPEFRGQWLSASKVTMYNNDKGRVGLGTTYICAHGNFKLNQIIVDLCPFEYLTVDTALPLKGTQRHTTVLTPYNGGTRVLWRFGQAKGRNRLHTLMLRVLFNRLKGRMKDQLKQGGAKVLEKIEQDQAVRQ